MSTSNAPILPRHEQAALRALIPHDGAAVHMELTVESESARARRMAVAQALANAEFEERVRCAWLPHTERFTIEESWESERVAGVTSAEWVRWWCDLKKGEDHVTVDDIMALVLRGWR